MSGTRRGARYHLEVVNRGPKQGPAAHANTGDGQAEVRAEPEQQGLGLGLAIVRLVAEIAGGELTLQMGSDVRGLKAVLELPCS